MGLRLQGVEARPIVFVTAFDQYAIQAFDVHAFGYLLEPLERTAHQGLESGRVDVTQGKESTLGDNYGTGYGCTCYIPA